METALCALQERPSAALPPDGLRILLVDDEQASLATLSDILHQHYAEVVVDTCDSGKAAMARIASTDYDVVISDIRRPGMDRLARLARTRKQRRHTPTLLVTWQDESDLAVQALRGGAYDFIHKPIAKEAFLTAFNRALVLRRHDREAEDHRRALQESEARFRSVAQSAHDAIISADSQGNIVFWNHGAQKIFGYTAEEVLGQPLTLLMPERYRAAHRSGLERLHQTGVGRVLGKTVELQGLRKDGAEFPLELSLASWQTAEGTFYTGIIRDIGERRQTEEHIRRLNDELKRQVAEAQCANKELEAFSYTVSHDLRAPLRAIAGFARILLEECAPQLSEAGQRYVRLVRDNAAQMGQLIDDLLAFSRLSRQPLRKQDVAVADVVQQVLESLHAEQAERKTMVLVGELPICQADAALLKQVYMNLLSNAFKYTRPRELAVIEIGCQNAGPDCVYFVKDNGIGFDMKYAPKLFGVFQRLHRAEDYEGTGVGLAIVRRIIHRHGGQVWAQAAVEQGATFYFTLAQAETPFSGETKATAADRSPSAPR